MNPDNRPSHRLAQVEGIAIWKMEPGGLARVVRGMPLEVFRLSGHLGFFMALMVSTTAARCETAVFSLDADRSTVAISGSVSAFNLFGFNWLIREQGIDGLVTPLGGEIVADVTSNALHFPGGSRITPWELENWEPGPFGTEGSAPASYGMAAGGPAGNLTLLMKAATRHWELDITSPVLPLTNGGFQSRLIRLPFVTNANSVLDYYFYLRLDPGDPDLVERAGYSKGGISPATPVITTAAGRHVMSGALTNRNNAGSNGLTRVAMENGLQMLTIPIDARHGFSITNGTHQFRFDLYFSGQLVAVETPASVELIHPNHPGGSMRISWPAGYTLQRATRLSPSDWVNQAVEPPLEIVPQQSAEFFRAVKMRVME